MAESTKRFKKAREHGSRLRTELISFLFGFMIYGACAYGLAQASAWLPGGQDPTSWGLFLLNGKNAGSKLILLTIPIVFAHFSRKAIFHQSDLSDMIHGENGAENLPAEVRSAVIRGTYWYYIGAMVAFAWMM